MLLRQRRLAEVAGANGSLLRVDLRPHAGCEPNRWFLATRTTVTKDRRRPRLLDTLR